MDLDEKTIHNRDLVVSRYVFPELDQMQAMIKVTLVNEENDSQQYSANYYSVYIDINILYIFYFNSLQFKCILAVSLVDLYAEIVGDLVREVSDSALVTLDASLSYNPNEPNSRQGDVNYVWVCDVHEDVDNCKEFVTASKIFLH